MRLRTANLRRKRAQRRALGSVIGKFRWAYPFSRQMSRWLRRTNYGRPGWKDLT